MPYQLLQTVTISANTVVDDTLGGKLAALFPGSLVRTSLSPTIALPSPSAPPISLGAYGRGQLTPLGTPLGTPLFANGLPLTLDGATLVLAALGQSISFVIAETQPAAAPDPSTIISVAGRQIVHMKLTPSQNVYIIAGSCLFLPGSEAISLEPANVTTLGVPGSGPSMPGGGGSTPSTIIIAPGASGPPILATPGQLVSIDVVAFAATAIGMPPIVIADAAPTPSVLAIVPGNAPIGSVPITGLPRSFASLAFPTMPAYGPTIAITYLAQGGAPMSTQLVPRGASAPTIVSAAAGVLIGIDVVAGGSDGQVYELTDSAGNIIAVIPANSQPGAVPLYGPARSFATLQAPIVGPNGPKLSVTYASPLVATPMTPHLMQPGAAAATLKNAAGTLYGLDVVAGGTAGVPQQPVFITDTAGDIVAVVPAGQQPGSVPIYGLPRPFAQLVVPAIPLSGPTLNLTLA